MTLPREQFVEIDKIRFQVIRMREILKCSLEYGFR